MVLKILYIINYAGKGGSEKYIKILAENMLKRGEEVFFVYNEDGLLRKQIEKMDIKTYKIDMNSFFDVDASKNIANICKENNIDIIHTQFGRENYIAIASRFFGTKAKIVHTSHIHIKNNFILKSLNSIFMKQNDAVIAVSNSIKNLLIENKYKEDKIRVIFNGVEPIEHSSKLSNFLKENYKISKEDFVFVTITRFSEEKGIFFLIDSVEELIRRTKEPFKLVFVGDGPLFEESEKYIRDKNLDKFIVLLGYMENTKEILEESDVFINSSESEALSFAILEAMANGLPIIATKVGGNIDIINEETNCGLLVNYNNKYEMSNAMKQLLRKEGMYKEFSQNSLTAIKNIFNIDRTVDSTYNLYKEIL